MESIYLSIPLLQHWFGHVLLHVLSLSLSRLAGENLFGLNPGLCVQLRCPSARQEVYHLAIQIPQEDSTSFAKEILSLHSLNIFVKEVLRRYPPFPGTFPRVRVLHLMYSLMLLSVHACSDFRRLLLMSICSSLFDKIALVCLFQPKFFSVFWVSS